MCEIKLQFPRTLQSACLVHTNSFCFPFRNSTVLRLLIWWFLMRNNTQKYCSGSLRYSRETKLILLVNLTQFFTLIKYFLFLCFFLLSRIFSLYHSLSVLYCRLAIFQYIKSNLSNLAKCFVLSLRVKILNSIKTTPELLIRLNTKLF